MPALVDMAMDTTTARGLLMLSLLLMPRLSHGIMVDTPGPTTAAITDTTTARGLLMLSPLLMPRLIHGFTMLTTQLTPMDTTTARGLLMLSLLLMPRLSHGTMVDT